MTIAERIHLFPSRTQQLSSLAPMILGGKLPGKVGRCRFEKKDDFKNHPFLFLHKGGVAEHGPKAGTDVLKTGNFEDKTSNGQNFK